MHRSDLERLSSSSDVDAHWSWNRKDQWFTADDRMQEFYTNWRSESIEQSNDFPYVLRLGMNDRGEDLLRFHPEDTADSDIVVTKAYEDMYNRILNLREGTSESNTRGVLLTGQPGVGKSTFLKYMLVRLISARQVVLLLDTKHVTLFYDGKVYYRSALEGFIHVPKPAGENDYSAWALIDMDNLNTGPTLDTTSEVWPIQASSLKPVQWKSWSKQFHAAEWGMPLWTNDELVHGLRLQKPYKAFRRKLEEALNEGSTPPTSDKAVVAALEVLNGNLDDRNDNVATGQDVNMLLDVDSAIHTLVYNGIENYGFSPRVVYGAIFQPSVTSEQHELAVRRLSYEKLEKLVQDFSQDGVLPAETSQYLISVSPIVHSERHPLDSWRISFGSIRIAKKVVMVMKKWEDQHLRHMFSSFYSSPTSSSLAGCVFEAIGHRMLCKGSRSNGEAVSSGAKVQVMYSNGQKIPTFSTAVPASTFGTRLPLALPLLDKGRNDASIDLTRDLDDLQAESETYYILEASHDPLFDAFTVAVNPSQTTALISVFQMTTSKMHHGSSKGYDLIHKIMDRVRSLNPGFNIRIAYWLVCPTLATSEECSWKVPDGWNTSTRVNNHRGDVFCLRIPVGFEPPGMV